MQNKSIGANILWWCEVIISARVLLFTLPVLINQKISGNAITGLEGCYIIVITLSACVYLSVGLSAIFGHKLSSMFHYIAAGLVFLMTIGMMSKSSTADGSMSLIHFIPLIFAIAMTCLAFVFTKKMKVT